MEQRRNIFEVLEDFRKPDLEDICQLFGREIPSRTHKAEMVRELAVYLTGSPSEWLDFMLERDLLLLSRLVDLGPDVRMRMNYPDYPTVPEITGIIDWDDSNEDYHEVWLREDMWQVVRPHVARAIRKGRESGRFELERLMIGYANLYGAIPYEQFLDRVIDYFERTHGPDLQALARYLQLNPFLKLCRFTEPGGSVPYVFAPGVEDAEELFRKRRQFAPEADYQEFSDEDAIAAGSGAPYFTFGLETPEGEELVDMLTRLGYDGDDLSWEIHEIWMCAQDPEENHALFDALIRRGDRIVGEAEYERSVDIIAAYANAMPKWYLCGHSADDTGSLRVTVEHGTLDATEGEEAHPHWEMPRPSISEGYTDLIETNPRLEALVSMMPSGFPFGMAIPHVAAEDPCPCGSGLKYAHCHGKFKS